MQFPGILLRMELIAMMGVRCRHSNQHLTLFFMSRLEALKPAPHTHFLASKLCNVVKILQTRCLMEECVHPEAWGVYSHCFSVFALPGRPFTGPNSVKGCSLVAAGALIAAVLALIVSFERGVCTPVFEDVVGVLTTSGGSGT